MKKSAKKARVWSEIEKGMMRFLEQGVLPYSGGAWPLKQTGLKTHPYSSKKDFPPTHTLIDIAIEEKRPDDVIRWYDQRKAASHLRKAQRVVKELDKEKEWQEYLSALRKANERKRRCIEILDGLQGRRIIEGH